MGRDDKDNKWRACALDQRTGCCSCFNQAQLELLDMMQWVKSPEALAELKQVISDFFAKKGQEELDAMWERGEMTEEKLKSFETLHERTPYRR